MRFFHLPAYDSHQSAASGRKLVLWALVMFVAVVVGFAVYYFLRGAGVPPGGKYALGQRPGLLSYDDLVTLSDTPRAQLDSGLRRRLDALLHTPFVNNEAYYAGAQPYRPVDPGFGPTMRVVSWNIERGLKFGLIRSALAGGEGFLDHLDPEDDDLDLTPEVRREVEHEMETLQNADVLVLQEVDWGMKRTEYRAVVQELAQATKMNWAYGVEFVEVDPFYLGLEEFGGATKEDRTEMRKHNTVDKDRYKGLHGTAVLSRYPIAKAQLIPLEHQGYDWFGEERKEISTLEGAKREAREKVFRTAITRQIRRGGRTLLLVDLDVPDLDEGIVTIAATHLESRAGPEARREQLAEILGYLHDIRNPVVLAGDMNTSGQDGTPTSWKREIYQRVGDVKFWANHALEYLSGVGIAFDAIVSGVDFLRRTDDPTVEDIPAVFPNEEAEFFDTLERFRFDDGYAFDFRGDAERSVNGKDGTLANSNNRDSKGFVVTCQVERTLGPAGKLKLDWIFVKAYATDPRNEKASYRFAPHHGRTMESLNYAVNGRLSDHAPISVDLPLPSGDSR